MPKTSETKKIKRIIDANVNRAKEGLRVCEEITRFILNDRNLTAQFKKIRHTIDGIVKKLPKPYLDFVEERAISEDVGKNVYVNELKRKGIKQVFFANIQRSKESLRVLEEFTKLIDKRLAIKFKKSRYSIYELEKKASGKIASVCDR